MDETRVKEIFEEFATDEERSLSGDPPMLGSSRTLTPTALDAQGNPQAIDFESFANDEAEFKKTFPPAFSRQQKDWKPIEINEDNVALM